MSRVYWGISSLVLALVACANAKTQGGPDASSGGGDGPRPVDAPSCGGIELPCAAVYVARSGNDSAPGTREAPLKTIGAAIAKAGQDPSKPSVFVQFGTYDEAITMSPGIHVYGGFDEAWRQNTAVSTEIVAGSPAVRFSSITTETILDHVLVKSADATGAGASSIAILVEGSTGVTLRSVDVVPGLGGDGVDGQVGPTGANGGIGGDGKPGCENSGGFCDSCPRPLGGAGGFSACERTGGAGGHAGHGVVTWAAPATSTRAAAAAVRRAAASSARQAASVRPVRRVVPGAPVQVAPRSERSTARATCPRAAATAVRASMATVAAAAVGVGAATTTATRTARRVAAAAVAGVRVVAASPAAAAVARSGSSSSRRPSRSRHPW